MKIIICGAGVVGFGITKHLANEGNDVTVIDQSAKLLDKISSSIDVKTIHGMPSYPSILAEANADKVDMLIAVTADDELNMITCQIAKSLFNVPRKIARIRNQNYLNQEWSHLFSDEQLPIDVLISPEAEVARTILNRLHSPGATDMYPVQGCKSKILAAKLTAGCAVVDRNYEFFLSRTESLNIGLMGVVRDNDFFIPNNKTVFAEGDEVYFVAERKDIRPAMTLFGHEEKEARRILIVGGGNIGFYVAKSLEAEDDNYRVKIIELETKRAEHIAEKLRDTMVINGSALEKEILEESNITTSEVIVSVTNDDEVNILGSLLANKMGCQASIALINSNAFAPLISNLGIDVTVNPRETTISSILGHIRRGLIKDVHAVHEGKAEIIEAEISSKLAINGKKMGDLDLPDDVKFGAIIRQGKFFKPSNDLALQPNDRVIVMSNSQKVANIEQLLSEHSG